MDHAIVLVKHMVQTKTENLELENYIKEMQAKMKEAGVELPERATRESAQNASSHVQEEDNEDEEDDESDYDSEFDSDDENRAPVPGGDLLEQIFHLQNVENANKLGISQKTQSKPLMKKAKAADKRHS